MLKLSIIFRMQIRATNAHISVINLEKNKSTIAFNADKWVGQKIFHALLVGSQVDNFFREYTLSLSPTTQKYKLMFKNKFIDVSINIKKYTSWKLHQLENN